MDDDDGTAWPYLFNFASNERIILDAHLCGRQTGRQRDMLNQTDGKTEKHLEKWTKRESKQIYTESQLDKNGKRSNN